MFATYGDISSMGKGTFSHWSRTFLLLEEDFFSSWTFLVRVGLFCVRVGLFLIGVGLFLARGGLFSIGVGLFWLEEDFF